MKIKRDVSSRHDHQYISMIQLPVEHVTRGTFWNYRFHFLYWISHGTESFTQGVKLNHTESNCIGLLLVWMYRFYTYYCTYRDTYRPLSSERAEFAPLVHMSLCVMFFRCHDKPLPRPVDTWILPPQRDQSLREVCHTRAWGCYWFPREVIQGV